MPRTMKDPFPGVDYSKYLDWERVVTPDGGTYYIVPGFPGYVYDPVQSNATGDKVFHRNPKAQLDEQQRVTDEQRRIAEQQLQNQSPISQLIPVAGIAGGTIAANYLKPAPTDPASQIAIDLLRQKAGLGQAGAAAEGATAAQVANQAILDTGEVISFTGEQAAPSMLQTATPVLGAAGTALGAYQAYQGVRSGNELQAGLGGIGAGLGLNAMGYALGPYGWAAMAAAPIALSLFNKKSTKEIESDRWKETGVSPDVAQSMYGHDYFSGTLGEESREEKYLTPDAIRLNPDNYHNIPEWDSWTRAMQDQFLSTMLAEKKVQEKKGGIYYDDKRAQELANQIREKKMPTTQAQAAAEGAMQQPIPPAPAMAAIPMKPLYGGQYGWRR